MHFDDRLATVLRSRVSGDATARIQYRQLLDLLGTLPVEAQGDQIDAACDRLGDLGQIIATSDRAAMLREPGMRLRNPRLLALLASGEAAVAAAAIERAQLEEDEWIDLAPALPPATRPLVRQRRDLGLRANALFDRLGMNAPGLPPVEAKIAEALRAANNDTIDATVNAADNAAKPSKIGAIVQRIEDFRKSRTPGEFQVTWQRIAATAFGRRFSGTICLAPARLRFFYRQRRPHRLERPRHGADGRRVAAGFARGLRPPCRASCTGHGAATASAASRDEHRDHRRTGDCRALAD